MNRLTSCVIFKIVDTKMHNVIVKSIKEAVEHEGRYRVPADLMERFINGFSVYKQPHTQYILKAYKRGHITPLLLADPVDSKVKPIHILSPVPAFGTNKTTYVNISAKADYLRGPGGAPTALDIKEVFMYHYLYAAYLDFNLKQHASIVDNSSKLMKTVTIAYSRLLTRCLDRAYPLSAKAGMYEVGIFLAAIFCLVTFFGRTIDEATAFIFAHGISNQADMNTHCSLYNQSKIKFADLTEFLELYTEEFSQYIKKGKLEPRVLAEKYASMYGPNSFFAIEHGPSFILMVTSPITGFYKAGSMDRIIKAQQRDIEKQLLTIFSSSYK